MPYLGTEVLGFSDILDFKSDILFFWGAISASETVFKKKKRISHTKKKGYHYIYPSIFWLKTPL